MTPEQKRLAEENSRVLNKLCKWRRFFVGWQIGSRLMSDREAAAIANHRELTILLRAEVTALTGMLIRKGVFTAEEYTRALIDEARQLDADYARAYPGFASSENGMTMKMPEAGKTMDRLGFPP